MATIIEREVHHRGDEDASSAMNTVIAVFAVVLIIGFALYALQMFPFAADSTGADVNVTVPDVTTPAR